MTEIATRLWYEDCKIGAATSIALRRAVSFRGRLCRASQGRRRATDLLPIRERGRRIQIDLLVLALEDHDDG
jgi:hypothetical protein